MEDDISMTRGSLFNRGERDRSARKSSGPLMSPPRRYYRDLARFAVVVVRC